ncbi:MAG: hypothetical protein QNL01_06300 [Akkermansiaceae bacterium]
MNATQRALQQTAREVEGVKGVEKAVVVRGAVDNPREWAETL